MAIDIRTFFDEETATFSYVVVDPSTNRAIIIDSVLNYDQFSGKSSTKSADELIKYTEEKRLHVEWILDTHIHADHLTASNYLKDKLGAKTGIGAKIKEVLKYWVPVFNTAQDTPIDGSQFDKLFEDNDVITFGNIKVRIMHTPGHTPACSSYLIEDAIFVGDTIFMPDVGTARTDFPGGSAENLYDSIQKIFQLPDNTRIFTCHDYPPQERTVQYMSTVQEQKLNNILINNSVSKNDYIQTRNKRDEGKAVPKLLLPSLQFNLRAGSFGNTESNGVKYIKIPVDKI